MASMILGLIQERRSKRASWVRHRPDLAASHAEHGWLLRERGDLPAAQEALERALSLDPGNIQALVELGLLYEAYHYPARARSLYERALQRDPDNAMARQRLRSMELSAPKAGM